jgi:tetratricopeptide (TPR) repeat protein
MKTFLALLIAALIVAPAALAQDRVDVGKEAIKSGNFLKAIEELRDAAKKDKKNPQAFYWLGVAYLKADSLDQSVAALIQARELDENNALIYESLGDAYTKQHLAEAAIQQFKRASEIDSVNVPLLMKLADADRKARKYTEAAVAYNQVVKLDTTNVAALTELGNLYMRGKQWANATRPLGMLARLKPADTETQMNYLKALSEAKDYLVIIPQAKLVLTLSPDNQAVKDMLVDAYLQTKQKDSAQQLLNTINPDSLDRDKLLAYGKVLKEKGENEKAADMMERAYRKDTSACDVPYELGTVYMRLKKWKDANAMFDRKIACDTTMGFQFASHLNEGMSMMQTKDFKQALAHIQAAVDRRPDNVQAWLTLAQCYAQLGEDQKKVEAYLKVLELAGADTTANGKYDAAKLEANRMIGVQYLLDKKYPKAMEYLKEALKYAQKDCQLLLWTAQCAQNSNLKEEARKFYCRVIKTCPNTPQAKDAEKGLDVLGLKCED